MPDKIVFNPGEEQYYARGSREVKRRIPTGVLLAIAIVCFLAAGIILYLYL